MNTTTWSFCTTWWGWVSLLHCFGGGRNTQSLAVPRTRRSQIYSFFCTICSTRPSPSPPLHTRYADRQQRAEENMPKFKLPNILSPSKKVRCLRSEVAASVCGPLSLFPAPLPPDIPPPTSPTRHSYTHPTYTPYRKTDPMANGGKAQPFFPLPPSRYSAAKAPHSHTPTPHPTYTPYRRTEAMASTAKAPGRTI